MKNIGLLFCFSLLMLYLPDAHAQVDWQWASGGGSTSDSSLQRLEEKALDIAVDKDGNSYVISRINYSNPAIAGNPVTVYSDAYYNDIALAAFDCSGNYKWSKIIGSHGHDLVQGVETDTLGNVYVVGKVKPGYQGGSVKPVNFSTDVVIPYSSNDDEYKKTIFLVQYDAQGNFQWLRMPQADNIATFDALDDYSHGLSVSPNGDSYWLVQIKPGSYANGAFVNTTPGWSLHILHYDINGVFQGAVPLDFKAESAGPYVNFDWERDHHSGRFYVSGYYLYNDEDLPNPVLGNNTVTHSMYAGAFDAQGNFLWMHENTETYSNPMYYGMAIGEMTALTLDHQGNLYLTGTSIDGDFFAGGEIISEHHPPPFPSDFYTSVPFVIKLDPEGNLLWINNADFAYPAPVNDVVVRGKEVAISGGHHDIKWGSININNYPNTGGRAYLIQLDKSTGNFISLDSINNIQNSSLIGTVIGVDPRGGYYIGGKFDGTLMAGSHQVTSNGGPSDFFVAKFGKNNCNCTLPEADFTYQADGQGGVSFTYTGTTGYDELEWGFGDGNISAAVAPTHTYAQNGLYWVCVTVYDSCGYDTYCEEVDTNLNARAFEAVEVRVYPNPAKTQVYVSTKETLRYQLYDLSGRKVKHGELRKGESIVDLQELSAGIYLLRVENGDEKTSVVKIIKE